jgi:hypothetical protein
MNETIHLQITFAWKILLKFVVKLCLLSTSNSTFLYCSIDYLQIQWIWFRNTKCASLFITFYFVLSYGILREISITSSLFIYQQQEPDSLVSIATDYRQDDCMIGVQILVGAGNFSLTTLSRPALGLTQPPFQWVPGALSLGVKWPGMKLTTHFLVPRSTMHAATPLLPQHFLMAWCLVLR